MDRGYSFSTKREHSGHEARATGELYREPELRGGTNKRGAVKMQEGSTLFTPFIPGQAEKQQPTPSFTLLLTSDSFYAAL